MNKIKRKGVRSLSTPRQGGVRSRNLLPEAVFEGQRIVTPLKVSLFSK